MLYLPSDIPNHAAHTSNVVRIHSGDSTIETRSTHASAERCIHRGRALNSGPPLLSMYSDAVDILRDRRCALDDARLIRGLGGARGSAASATGEVDGGRGSERNVEFVTLRGVPNWCVPRDTSGSPTEL